MSEAKHTPGPWIVKKNIDGIYAGTMSLVATESSGEIVGPRQIRHQANGCVEANARLIAAAPDLLDALKGLVEAEESIRATYTRTFGKTPEDDDHYEHEKWAEEFLQEKADKARAAIAKATGGAAC